MTTNDRFKEAVDLTIDLDLPQDTALPGQQKQHIPVILKDMADSFEDGVERAALATLATVFGVREYTQSTVFWKSQEATGTGPNSNHRHTNGAQLNSTVGISPMTSKSALTHSLASNISDQHHGFQFSTVSHQQHYVSPHSQQNTPLYLDPMQKDNPLPGSNPSSACTYPVGATTFILPDIPAVSNFDDWLTTSSQVYPSKACVVSPSSFKTLSSFPTHKQQRQHYQDTEVAPPLVFYSYPPAIFDLLVSNTDDRIVLWGPDPQYISISGPHMANYSVTSLQQAPSRMGFSSSSTTAAAHSGASIRDSQKSATSWINKMKRSIYSHVYPSTTDNNENRTWTAGRLQKKHTLRHRLRHRLSSNMGQQQQPYSSDTSPPMMVQAATVEKLVEILTVTLDYTFMTDFFLTYQTFISPLQLCKLLILRFQWGLKNDEDDRRIVRIRTFVVIRHWLLNYFVHDFKASRELRHSLTTFVNSLPSYSLIKQSPLDRRIVKGLKRVIRRLKKVHYPKSSQRVQVISPPPPTFDQDHVHGKLSQSSLRRNTHELLYKDRTLDGNWHHGNMTFQEARTADIAVVGTSDKLHLPLAPSIPPSSLLSPPSTNRYGSINNDYMTQSQLLSSPSYVDIDSIRQRKTSQNSVVRYAMSAFSKKKIQQQQLRNVKESYLRRMEQQKRMMMSQQQQGSPGTTSDISLDSIISPGTTDDELDKDGDDEGDGSVIANDQLEVMDDRMTQNGSYQVPHEDDRMQHNQPYGNSLMANHPHRRSVYNAGLSDLSPLVSPSGSVIHGPLTNRFGGSRSNGRSVMKPSYGRQLVTPSSSMDNMLPLPMALNMDGSDREKTESAIANEYHDSSETPLGTPISSSNRHLHQLKNRVSKALLENGEENSHLVGKMDTGNEKALIESPSSMSLKSNEFGSTRKLSHRLINAFQSTGNIPSARATVVQPATMTASSIASSIHQNSIVAQSNHRHCYNKPDTPHPHTYQQHYGHLGNNNISTEWTPSQSLTLDLHTPHRHHYEHWHQPDRSYLSDIRASLDEDGIEAEEQDHIYQQPHLPERGTILQQPNDNIPPTLVALFKPALVLQHRSHSLAQQFCLVEKWILLQIDWEELVHCRWTKMGDCGTDVDDPGAFHSKAGDNQKDGVKQLINRFNMVCRWVSSEIVRTPSLDERVLVIEKFIRLAQKCHTYANFATLLQILLGLQSPSISRLEKTWSKVGDSEMQLLKQLSWFTSPTKNWKHLRDSMTAVVEEYGMSSGIKLPFGGCIPFLGLYLSDLVFNSEQSSYLEPNHAHHKIYHSYTRPTRDLSPALLRQPLVNFRKHRITATVIKRFLTFRDLATRYSFEQVDNVYSACFDLDALETESLGQLSLAIEPS